MYTLIKLLSLKEMLAEQLPIMLAALIIAELFYKFHSFTLETLTFLATWFAIDYAVNFVNKLWEKYRGDEHQK